jgi:glutaminase
MIKAKKSLARSRALVSTALLTVGVCAGYSATAATPTRSTLGLANGKGSADIQTAMTKAYNQYKGLSEGKNADYIPALAKVDSKLFGIAIVSVDGTVYEVGDTKSQFSIQSAAKPFVFGRALEDIGPKAAEEKIGVNATGMPFNSIIAMEMNKETHPAMNPLVNPGAIATVSYLKANAPADRWQKVISTMSSFAGRQLDVDQVVYKSESETNTRNRAISWLLKADEVLQGDPGEMLDVYTKECSISVNAKDLAVMGATLANGGVNPITKKEVVDSDTAAKVLAVMSTAGLYDTTGTWMYRVGMPAKSGVGGGIVAVQPGKFAIGTFSPPLDKPGNSVRGQRAIESIAQDLHAGVFTVQKK